MVLVPRNRTSNMASDARRIAHRIVPLVGHSFVVGRVQRRDGRASGWNWLPSPPRIHPGKITGRARSYSNSGSSDWVLTVDELFLEARGFLSKKLLFPF